MRQSMVIAAFDARKYFSANITRELGFVFFTVICTHMLTEVGRMSETDVTMVAFERLFA